jgi:hypothetical protein
VFHKTNYRQTNTAFVTSVPEETRWDKELMMVRKRDAKRFCCVGSVAVCLGLDQSRRGAAKL